MDIREQVYYLIRDKVKQTKRCCILMERDPSLELNDIIHNIWIVFTERYLDYFSKTGGRSLKNYVYRFVSYELVNMLKRIKHTTISLNAENEFGDPLENILPAPDFDIDKEIWRKEILINLKKKGADA